MRKCRSNQRRLQVTPWYFLLQPKAFGRGNNVIGQSVQDENRHAQAVQFSLWRNRGQLRLVRLNLFEQLRTQLIDLAAPSIYSWFAVPPGLIEAATPSRYSVPPKANSAAHHERRSNPPRKKTVPDASKQKPPRHSRAPCRAPTGHRGVLPDRLPESARPFQDRRTRPSGITPECVARTEDPSAAKSERPCGETLLPTMLTGPLPRRCCSHVADSPMVGPEEAST